MKFSGSELKQSYSIWGEDTTTSPSGTHLGHYKACLRHIRPRTTANDDDTEHPEHISDKIFELKAQVLNIAFQNNIIIPRWKTILNIMLEKIPGKPHVQKLRIIHIIENDFNMATGILWGRRLMSQGESLNQFGEEQSGSRKNKQCPDVLLLKHLTYSILRLSKRNGTTFDNDAKSCYDRIVMLLASLASQRLGMPAKACKTFLTLLSQVQYKTRTSHGISDSTYGTTLEHTIHGPGQGGRASPAIWTVISSLILDCMKTKSNGLYLEDPYFQNTIKQTSSGFVDDITHWNTTQHWEQLLHSTGGKLALEKCLYYAIYWDFDDEGIPSMKQENPSSPARSIYSNQTQRLYRITQNIGIDGKSSRHIHRGNQTPAEKGETLCPHDCVQFSFPRGSKDHIPISVHPQHDLQPRIRYTLLLQDATSIQSSTTSAFLPAMGYPRTFPHAVVYASTETGGLGFQHFVRRTRLRQGKKDIRLGSTQSTHKSDDHGHTPVGPKNSWHINCPSTNPPTHCPIWDW
jgi:hypothetical protein